MSSFDRPWLVGNQNGVTHGMSHTGTYKSWRAMMQRCGHWKGRDHAHKSNSITVCERWQKFENFFEDMGERPQGKTLDRYPNQSGNYEPGNCRWATLQEQQRNMKSNRLLTFDGRTQCLKAWAEELKITPEAINMRLRKLGWSIEKALSTGAVK